MPPEFVVDVQWMLSGAAALLLVVAFLGPFLAWMNR